MQLDAQSPAVGSASPPALRPTVGDHFDLFDVMRAVAIIAIVWLHTVDSPRATPWRDLGRFGVPFFCMGAVLFQVQSLRRKPNQSFTAYAWRRFMRLYVPFLIWSLIYLAARGLKHAVFHTGEPFAWRGMILYVGPSEQLWFLPFLMTVNVALFWPAKTVLAHSRRRSRAASAATRQAIDMSARSTSR